MTTLNTTSYAILGLLNLREYTAYELAAQSRRSLRYVWPKAESRLYDEPKRLSREGFITIRTEPAGPVRRRQVYRITAKGRRALRTWLGTDSAPPRLEFEALLRVFLADSGSVDDLRATLACTRAQAEAAYQSGMELIGQYSRGEIAFEERLHLNMIWALFSRDLLRLIIDWAEFAEGEVHAWKDAQGGGPTPRAQALLQALASEEQVLSRPHGNDPGAGPRSRP